MSRESPQPDVLDPDVVVVGGGPAGCAAAVFAARYGFDTVVFDRGTGSLDRCAFLTNYPGFPAGIDVETFQSLTRDHVREAGANLVENLVESVSRADEATDAAEVTGVADSADGTTDRFVVETQDGRRATTDQIIAATRYDGSYLAPLDDGEMFETVEYHGEEREQFDPEYPDADGRTPIDGLYVASPAGERDVQAVVAAGRGAHVARSLIEDVRAERGFPGDLARHYDWLRPESEFAGEWADRDRWRESFDERVPDDAELSAERQATLREEHVANAFDSMRSETDVETLTERAHRRLAAELDDEAIADVVATEILVASADTDDLLDTVDDEAIREYLADTGDEIGTDE